MLTTFLSVTTSLMQKLTHVVGPVLTVTDCYYEINDDDDHHGDCY